MQALGDKYYISTNKLKRKTILRKPEVSFGLMFGLLLHCVMPHWLAVPVELASAGTQALGFMTDCEGDCKGNWSAAACVWWSMQHTKAILPAGDCTRCFQHL